MIFSVYAKLFLRDHGAGERDLRIGGEGGRIVAHLPVDLPIDAFGAQRLLEAWAADNCRELMPAAAERIVARRPEGERR